MEARLFKSNHLRTVIGFLISGFLLWLTFEQSGLTLKKIYLKEGKQFFFVLAIGSFVAAILVHAQRAKLLWINAKTNSSSVATFPSLILGNFYNCVLPGNMGELIRAWYFSFTNKVSFNRSLASIASEKWIDAQLFVVMAALLLLTKPYLGHPIQIAILYVSSAVAMLMPFYWLMNYNSRFKRIVWKTMTYLGWSGRFLFRIYLNVYAQINALYVSGLLPRYIALCCLLIIFNLCQFYFLLIAANVDSTLISLYTLILIAASMMIIAFIPSAPGNAGVLHYGLYSVLILAAEINEIVPDKFALQNYALFGVYVHLSYLIPEGIMGLILLIIKRNTVFQYSKSVAVEKVQL